MPNQSESKRAARRDSYDESTDSNAVNDSPVVLYSRSLQPGFPFKYISENVESLLGHRSEELLADGVLWPRLLLADDYARVLKCLEGLSETKPCSETYSVSLANGQLIQVRDEIRLICDGDGQPLELAGVWVRW